MLSGMARIVLDEFARGGLVGSHPTGPAAKNTAAACAGHARIRPSLCLPLTGKPASRQPLGRATETRSVQESKNQQRMMVMMFYTRED
jgi:hypothetical protein